MLACWDDCSVEETPARRHFLQSGCTWRFAHEVGLRAEPFPPQVVSVVVLSSRSKPCWLLPGLVRPGLNLVPLS
ncbi:unnamed protein product [Merluccius merluccius]